MLVNGKQSQSVELAERGFNFGDGHFTTIKVIAGEVLLLPLHIARLKHACTILSITFEHWDELEATIEYQASLKQQGILKVTITRGVGGNGYGTNGCSSANWYLQFRPIPSHYQQWREAGIGLTVCSYQQTVTPHFAGLKTLNRLDQVMIRQELDKRNANDGLVCSTDGFVIETSMANVFWINNNVVFTPSIHRSGVEGVMRAHIIDLLKGINIRVKEADYSINEVFDAQEVFISNAAMELVPIHSIVADDIGVEINYDYYHHVGSITAIVQALLSR